SCGPAPNRPADEKETRRSRCKPRPAEPFDCPLERLLAIAVVYPGLAPADKYRHVPDREAFGIEVGFDLCPGQWHGHYRARTGARRQWCYRVRHPVIAEIIEEDAPSAQFLGHVHDIELRIPFRHSNANFVGESLCLRPSQLAFLGSGKRCDDMQSFASGCLAEADEAEFVEPLSHFLCRFDDGGERDVGAGVQIEDETPRNFRMLRLAVPGMQFERSHLCDSGETFHAIDLKIRFAIAENGDELQQIGAPWHGMTLKELLAGDAVRCPDDRTGAALNV